MIGRKSARNMYSRNTNKIVIWCICWFYLHGICYDVQSYDSKIPSKNVPIVYVYVSTSVHFMQFWWLFATGSRMELEILVANGHHNCIKYTNAYVQLRTPDDGQ